MIEKQEQVFENYDKDCLLEKIEKYGDPNKNLIITSVLILFIAGLIVFFFGKREIGGITADYADYYPQSTNAYIDVQLNDKSILEINKLTTLDIKNLPGLLIKVFNANYRIKKSNKLDKLINQVLGDEFSYGIWNSKGIDRSLIIFPIKRESKIDPLFRLLLSKNEKLTGKIYQGFRIITAKNTKIAYLINRDRLFVADSYESLVFIINNYILKDAASLYDRKDVRKALAYVDKGRIGTILLTNSTSNNDLLNNITNNKFSAISGFFDRSIPTTAIAMRFDRDLFYLNSYTPYFESKIEGKNVEKAFQAVFDNEKQNLIPDFLPQNTISYFTVSGLKNYINLYLELSGIKDKTEFEQLKQFVKMTTTLDFDNDIMEIFSKNSIFATIASGNLKPGYAIILSTTPKTSLVISKFIKLLQIQVPSEEISKISYKNTELNIVSSPKLPAVLCYGNIDQNLYAIGDKLAVELIIDTIKAKKSFSNNDLFGDFKEHALYNSGITAFIDIQKINKFAPQKRKFPEKNYLDKIKNNINAAFITADYKGNTFIGSMQFSMKNKKIQNKK
ncbi:MAG: DUF3352 domain-containing protein [Candidatus Gastranaerophilales bacterium]|nr:DUF3352 domain-containing protein [Candidatus Gastranaerophilales bacterium]